MGKRADAMIVVAMWHVRVSVKERLSASVDADLVAVVRSGCSDAIDASVVCLAGDGDDILTSDPGGLRALARAAGIHVELIPV
jgi:DNA-binding transcriptional MocR family regulator